MPDLGNWGQCGRLTKAAPYGQHIRCRCRVHPENTYSTKNIAPFGARSIFATAGDCPCPASSLELDPIYATMPDMPD